MWFTHAAKSCLTRELGTSHVALRTGGVESRKTGQEVQAGLSSELV